MVEMKAAGLSYASIAVKFNISRQRIQTYFSPPIKIMEKVAEKCYRPTNRLLLELI